MSLALPHAIACFFAASNTGDAAVLLPHLADDAVVHDERHQHRGAAAIAAWLVQTQATTPYRAVPLGVHTRASRCASPRKYRAISRRARCSWSMCSSWWAARLRRWRFIDAACLRAA